MRFLEIDDEEGNEIWINFDKVAMIQVTRFKGEDMTRLDLLRQIRCAENESYMTFGNYSGDRKVTFSGENKKLVTKAMKNALEERLKELEEEIEKI